jgi:hypothetical protein
MNSRSFSHVLRPNYEKFAPRCDMTETVFFNSSQKVSHSKPLDISFYLSDQISSFRVSCNIISKSGKIASSSDLEIKSSKGVYSQMNLPLKIYDGDILQTPVKIFNSYEKREIDAEVVIYKNGEEQKR